MQTDMSPQAVTVRLLRTAQLRRLCLELGRGSPHPRLEESAEGSRGKPKACREGRRGSARR